MNSTEKKITIPCSPEEYYYKLDNMVLSSSQYVRNTFKSRWKSETEEDWVDEKEFIQKFIKGLGKNAYKQAQSFQKKSLNESSSLNDWDMSLIAVVIRNFGDESKYEKENSAVRQLKDLRNELSHNTSKKYTEAQYNEHVNAFKDALLCLGIGESDINKLIERAGVTSSLKAYERVKVLFREAEKFMKKENFKDAIERYSEAITTPSLLPINLGETYEKRANCYLKSVKSKVVDGEHCDQALLDVQQALELNSSSWNANYLAAQCYRRKNDLNEALRFYETSLALSPAQKQVKRDWDNCKVLAGVYARKDNLNPNMMPMNLEERIAHYNNESGNKMSKEQFIKINTDIAAQVVKGQDHVFRGHQYFYGWEVEQSFTEAVKYFTKADKVGNPEGSYNLAMCYEYGRGVQADVKKALEIYRKVANMDKNILGQQTPLQFNAGVASAQHAIGLCYENGIGVEQDYKEAALWYQKAMENGIGNAANNLGLLYSKGQGVELNEKMAEMCWKQGVNLKDVNAADSLVTYFINQMEPEMAKEWIKIGREVGSDRLIMTSNEEFAKTLEIVKFDRVILEPTVIEFEKRYNLETKGLTFKQRWARVENYRDPNMAKISKAVHNTAVNDTISPEYIENWGGMVQPLTPEKICTLFERANQGSITAQRIIRTVKCCTEIDHLLETSEENNDEYKNKILNMFYEIAVLEFHFFFTNSSDSKQKLKSIVAALFEETCDEKGVDDMKRRYCYVTFNLQASLCKPNDTYALEILKEGLRRYSDNRNYYEILLCCMGHRKLWKEGVLYGKEALSKFPDDVELLYYYAVILRCENVNNLEVKKAYEKFLNVAPREHRKVPEAFYHISSVYLNQYIESKENKSLDLAKHYLKRGEEAEKDQLPCYLPYGDSNVKNMVTGFLGKMEEFENVLSFDNSPTRPFTKPKSILERKPYLKSPVRKDHILQHRHNLKGTKKTVKSKKNQIFLQTIPPKLNQTVAKKLSTVEPITLQEMNPTEDKIFDNRLLELTIIDEPNPYFSSIHLVGEDENGDTTRLYIYNVKRDPETMKRFQVGCRIAIINPYMRISGNHSSNGIRNDEIKCIVDLEKVNNMCRFCGEENATLSCKKCKKPYCSTECLNLDLEQFEHKLLCFSKSNS